MGSVRTGDFSLHWKESLLGELFWREQEALKQHNGSCVEACMESQDIVFRLLTAAGRSPSRHNRSPSNLSDDYVPPVQMSPKRHRRRFSSSHAWPRNSFASTSTSTVAGSLAVNRDSLPITSCLSSSARFIRRAGSLLRAPFKMSSTKAHVSESIDSLLGNPVQGDLGSPERPLLCFRGGALWNCLPRDMEVLCMDLFWPVNDSQETANDMLDVIQMAPLSEFRSLRSLSITGMMQSYQKYIWPAVWLNPDLEELELGMALPPCIFATFVEKQVQWPLIQGAWRPQQSHSRVPVYSGHLGDGNLHPKVGIGEYFDKYAIEKAGVLAGVAGRTLNRLSIKRLTLSGFVIDADPFIQWFDHRRLRSVRFKDDCIDAGFYLPKSMRRVHITFQREGENALFVRHFDLFKNLKVVELRGAKTIGQVPYRSSEILHTKCGRSKAVKECKKTHNRSMSTPPAMRTPKSGDLFGRSSRAEYSQLGYKPSIG